MKSSASESKTFGYTYTGIISPYPFIDTVYLKVSVNRTVDVWYSCLKLTPIEDPLDIPMIV